MCVCVFCTMYHQKPVSLPCFFHSGERAERNKRTKQFPSNSSAKSLCWLKLPFSSMHNLMSGPFLSTGFCSFSVMDWPSKCQLFRAGDMGCLMSSSEGWTDTST